MIRVTEASEVELGLEGGCLVSALKRSSFFVRLLRECFASVFIDSSLTLTLTAFSFRFDELTALMEEVFNFEYLFAFVRFSIATLDVVSAIFLGHPVPVILYGAKFCLKRLCETRADD